MRQDRLQVNEAAAFRYRPPFQYQIYEVFLFF
jgi:hypothetical protein